MGCLDVYVTLYAEHHQRPDVVDDNETVIASGNVCTMVSLRCPQDAEIVAVSVADEGNGDPRTGLRLFMAVKSEVENRPIPRITDSVYQLPHAFHETYSIQP